MFNNMAWWLSYKPCNIDYFIRGLKKLRKSLATDTRSKLAKKEEACLRKRHNEAQCSEHPTLPRGSLGWCGVLLLAHFHNCNLFITVCLLDGIFSLTSCVFSSPFQLFNLSHLSYLSCLSHMFRLFHLSQLSHLLYWSHLSQLFYSS